jgi:hypothetical protein
VIRIVIDYYVVRASPAPAGGKFPIIWKDFKTEAAVEPETVTITVNPGETIRMRRAEIRKAAVFIGAIDVETRVVPVVVPVPSVVADVGPLIHSAVLVSVMLRRATLRPSLRWRWNLTAVSPVDGRRVLWRGRVLSIIAALRKRASSRYESQYENGPENLLHDSLHFEKHFRLSNEQRKYPIH